MSRLYYKKQFKSDIFNQNNSIIIKPKFQKKYHNCSASDVFNKKDTNKQKKTELSEIILNQKQNDNDNWY